MSPVLFHAALVWHALLILALLVHAIRVRSACEKLIAFDGLSVVFLSALVFTALARNDPRLLDIGLVVAMLVFAQTVAAARLIARLPEEE